MLWTNNKIRIKAHRFAWELYKGKIPTGKFILHNCPDGKDNPLCVNTNHLYLGNQQQNNLDRINKKRSSPGQIFKTGHAEFNAKLTIEQVKKIKKMLKQNNHTLVEIGKMFNISMHTIFDIKREKTWKHVTLDN